MIVPAISASTDLFGASMRILGVAGDQQAATVGQGCFAPGMMKSTYGTGCFALLNTGEQPVASKNRLLTTIAYQLDGQRTYALEGAIFVAGAAVQWLRDALKVIAAAPDVNALAAAADPAEQVYLVPAFVGLGAPWWDAQARGAIFGLTRKSGVAELARAALEAVGYQTRDLLEAMRADWPASGASSVLRVDGGMAASDATMQFLADISGDARRSSSRDGDDRARCRLSGRPCRGIVSRSAGLCRDVGARAAVRTADGRRDARAQMGGLARRGRAHAEPGLSAAAFTAGIVMLAHRWAADSICSLSPIGERERTEIVAPSSTLVGKLF